MTILLPALAVAIAAFCVWLTVRIVNRRERWAEWLLALTLIVGGVLGVFLEVAEQERQNEQAQRELQKLLEEINASFSKR